MRRSFFRSIRNVYDGRFTFVRAEYRQYGGWAADYPTMANAPTPLEYAHG
jgi:hypothetical protein